MINNTLDKKIPLKRDFVLSGEINKTTISNIINGILEVNSNDRLMESLYKNWETKPINVFINSFGGSVYDGLALIDIIEQSRTPVNTISIGSCMSIALWIFLSGHTRIIGKHSTLMFHDISSWIFDKLQQIKENIEEYERLRNMFIDTVLSNSKITRKEINNIILHKKDWYISSDKAIELGLADEYYF